MHPFLCYRQQKRLRSWSFIPPSVIQAACASIWSIIVATHIDQPGITCMAIPTPSHPTWANAKALAARERLLEGLAKTSVPTSDVTYVLSDPQRRHGQFTRLPNGAATMPSITPRRMFQLVYEREANSKDGLWKV